MTIKDDKALDQFRGPGICCICGKKVFRREPFHIIAAGMGSASRIDHPYNVLSVCGAMTGGDDCHCKWHSANLTIRGRQATQTDMFGFVAVRDGVRHRDVEDAVVYFKNLSPKLNETEIQKRLGLIRPGVSKLVKVLLAAKEGKSCPKPQPKPQLAPSATIKELTF